MIGTLPRSALRLPMFFSEIAPLPPTPVAILVNRGPTFVVRFAEAHPGVIVVPFFTGPLENAPNFKRVRFSKAKHWAEWPLVAQCFYLGNLSPHEKLPEAIHQMITFWMRDDPKIEFVHDESEEAAKPYRGLRRRP